MGDVLGIAGQPNSRILPEAKLSQDCVSAIMELLAETDAMKSSRTIIVWLFIKF